MESRNENYNFMVKEMFGENWTKGDEECLQGAHGVMIVLAYLDGAKPYLENMSNELDIPQSILSLPFSRLNRSGIFSKKFDAQNDKWLTYQKSDVEARCAWSYLAAMAADIIQRNYYCI